jgi:hypothetical protein
MATNNSINANTTGIVGYIGSAFTATSATQYNVVVGGASTSTLAMVAPSATSGIPLVSGGSSANPSFTTAAVAGGGTGFVTAAVNGVVYGNTTSPLGVTAAGTNGQVLLGATSAAPAFATLTSTGGTIAYTLGANSLNLDVVDGGFVWSVITADQVAAVNNGYIANKAGLLTLTLPTTAAAGTTLALTGMNTALGWKLGQNANQIVHFGTSTTTTGTGGSLASINIRDSIELVCVVANLEWNVINSVGNITVV